MKQKISGLLTVKSIVTLALTAVFCYLSIIGDKIKEGVKKYDNRD